MKWKYDKTFKEWYVGDNSRFAFTIYAPGSASNSFRQYKLVVEQSQQVLWFKKLVSAKEVARLIEEG